MNKKRIHTTKSLEERRKILRTNSTIQEIIMWNHLKGKNLGYKFQRQHSIGPYIVDFYCAQRKLIVEIDGSQHIEAAEYDVERTEFFTSLGYTVVRFWNNEVSNNLTNVLEQIRQKLH